MANPTASIEGLTKLMAFKDQLTSGQVADIKQHLLDKKSLPPNFFTSITDLRDLRSIMGFSFEPLRAVRFWRTLYGTSER